MLTGLTPETTYWITVGGGDAAGNQGSSMFETLRTRAPGVAVQTAPDFRTGRLSGDLRVGDTGFGALVLPRGGAGTFVSAALDSRQKVHWTAAVVDVSHAPGARWTLAVRTGDRPTPDRTWSGWTRVRGDDLDRPGRYLQFRLRLSAPGGTRASVTAVGFTHDGTLPSAPGELSPPPG